MLIEILLPSASGGAPLAGRAAVEGTALVRRPSAGRSYRIARVMTLGGLGTRTHRRLWMGEGPVPDAPVAE